MWIWMGNFISTASLAPPDPARGAYSPPIDPSWISWRRMGNGKWKGLGVERERKERKGRGGKGGRRIEFKGDVDVGEGNGES